MFASLLYADDEVMFASNPQQPVAESKVVRLGTKTYISKAILFHSAILQVDFPLRVGWEISFCPK